MSLSAGLIKVNTLSVTGASAGAVSATNFNFTNLDVAGDLTVAGTVGVVGDLDANANLNVSGSIALGTDVPPDAGPQGNGLKNGTALFTKTFNADENPYYITNKPYNFITQLYPNQTYRNSTSMSMENDSFYFNSNLTSDLSGGVLEPQSTETWNVPIFYISPLTKERPDMAYVINSLLDRDEFDVGSKSYNMSGISDLNTGIKYSPDTSNGIYFSGTVNTDLLDANLRVSNKMYRGSLDANKYIPDARNQAQVDRAKEVGSYDFIDYNTRELICDTGIQFIKLPGDFTTPITKDPTDMYRVYATQDTSNHWAVWPTEQSELPDWLDYLLDSKYPVYNQPTLSLDSSAVQFKLDNDYNQSSDQLVYTNGIANAEFRIQYRSYVPTVMNGVLTSGSVTSLNIVESGKGFTSVPTLSTNYIRYWNNGTNAAYPSISGFDDAVILCKTVGSSLIAPYGDSASSLDPSGAVIRYAGSGFNVPDGTELDIEFFDAENLLYGAYFYNAPMGKATIVGGVVHSVRITEESGYLYPPVYGKIASGRDRANISVTLNADTTLSFNKTSNGSGYTSTPIFSTFGGTDMTFARASATVVGGAINNITVTTHGAGYINSKYVTVEIVDSYGHGAAAHAVVTNGSVSSIVVDTPGTGYSNNVQVNINGGRPWIYVSRNIDYSYTNISSVLTQLIKNPNGHTVFCINNMSNGTWDRRPILPDGNFDLSANYLDSYYTDNQSSWSWLPKIFQYLIDYPDRTIADYQHDKNTYTPDRNAGDKYSPFVGSFDTTRFTLDLTGVQIMLSSQFFGNGSYLLFTDPSGVYHYDKVQDYLNEYYYDLGDSKGGDQYFSFLYATKKDIIDEPENTANAKKYFRTYCSLLIPHEFGHTSGLGHTDSEDLLFSTGYNNGGSFTRVNLVINPNADQYLKKFNRANTLKLEDGTSFKSSPYNVMSYNFVLNTITKEQRLIMRNFLYLDRISFIHSITNEPVNTDFLDKYLDSSGVSKETIRDLNTNQVKSYSVVSDKVQARLMESDHMDVNGMVRSQMNKSELGIFGEIVMGNDQQRIYIDTSGNFVLGNIVLINDNGVIRFEAKM